ncbi:Uncharacterized protein AC504_3643 [Pseudomonas syringae pv. maculicola]|uniref:Uncharacterized protein n=1 Tax=Pseudomonas amygdali pv. lachrymans TaxID=53707 RepID=A0ABR5L1G1_PSEAV|nr:Uncharacterized protein AC513_4901 [Pseudomonas savastanoi pv. phaseolicola]KPB66417.1 Uncharacterized protein AC508_4724 [Pseudomonas amygdali pv. mellea]KPB85495.1 Uncharacterized protein AC504_3643 [Pseudomonas syringae pv. maculicola]KPC02573.1 Uncharacterized protein AC501_0559 [Pseudomonas amygdali pv. lachrymans]RMV78726.1 hypothetical protein ALP07_101461 [Pseudomonas savastanoi pv. glycinea]
MLMQNSNATAAASLIDNGLTSKTVPNVLRFCASSASGRKSMNDHRFNHQECSIKQAPQTDHALQS